MAEWYLGAHSYAVQEKFVWFASSGSCGSCDGVCDGESWSSRGGAESECVAEYVVAYDCGSYVSG